MQPPITAAWIGAAYWSSWLLEALAARQRCWANARVAVISALVFSTVTLVATVLHLDRFHLGSPDLTSRIAAWAWLVVYVGVPPLLLVGLVLQQHVKGSDPPRRRSPATWVLRMLTVQAVVFALVGLLLLVAPQASSGLWPWTLTPLTARAVAAWLLGLAAAAIACVREREYERIRAATASFALFGVLQVITLARYAGEIDWRGPAAWVYVVILMTVLAVSAGALLGPRAQVHDLVHRVPA